MFDVFTNPPRYLVVQNQKLSRITRHHQPFTICKLMTKISLGQPTFPIRFVLCVAVINEVNVHPSNIKMSNNAL
jgi:hypothetical protein